MTDYKLLNSQLVLQLKDDSDALANAANVVALLFNAMDDVNWLGFYVLRGDELVLGPFQGNTATTRIALGKGVCGTAAVERATQRVPDVHAFPGHIACDAASKSELVVPLIKDGELLGVLDIDSPLHDRFSKEDQDGIESICEAYLASLDKDWI